MARDDYFVIVYQVLAYLYKCLKNGVDVDTRLLEYNSTLIKANNQRYWNYIICNLYKSGMIEGVDFASLDGVEMNYPISFEHCRITPKGIEYLCDNSLMEKVKRFLKDVKELVPFELLDLIVQSDQK